MTASAQPQRRVDKRFAESQGREKTGWEVTDMWDTHHQVKRRIYLGQSNKEIALALNISKEHVSSIRNSDIVQAQLKEMQLVADKEVINIKEEINKLQPKAVRKLQELLDSDKTPPNVLLGAIKDTLDRGGNAAPQQVQHLHGHFTGADLEAMKQQAKNVARSNGLLNDPNVIDAEVSELD